MNKATESIATLTPSHEYTDAQLELAARNSLDTPPPSAGVEAAIFAEAERYTTHRVVRFPRPSLGPARLSSLPSRGWPR